ncbi:MAG: hypothetical protein M0O94_04750 [Bacteroidales bacterium]|nr:hypothetical protein [Bacteroidales bacterium]MDD3962336.1 hypothetical protein [Bacteroidales bacterium]MDY0285333.1 hypothetical protein [Bacteroidales bacterium]HPE86241.1 hypothetical protein [Bacteroidales bacterium]
MVKTIVRILAKTITGIFLIGFIALFPYTLTPVYRFAEEAPFSGSQLYNPYSETDFTCWQRINFHAHSDYWGSIGITNALYSTPENISRAYRESLGYTLAGISDYQHINRSLDTSGAFIPVYEHGMNIQRVHQLPVNAKRVTWLDYVLWQGLNHKQHILKALNRQSDFIILAHPKLDQGYSKHDFRKLGNYQAIEILNTFAYWLPAREEWDAALSAGHYVLAAGNDDLHNLGKEREFGYRFNSLATCSTDSESLLSTLQKGNYIVTGIHREAKDNRERKKQKLDGVEERIHSFTVRGDTLSFSVSHPTFFLAFIGQDGKILAKEEEAETLTYVMKPGDSYARAEAHFTDHTNIFLNPVIRYSGDITEYHKNTSIKPFQTVLFIILRLAVWISVFSFILIKVMLQWRPKKA